MNIDYRELCQEMLWLLACVVSGAAEVLFDNAVSGAPEVTCNRGSISLSVGVEHGTPSVVFAKGHFGSDGCSFRNQSHVAFDFDKCNIRRKREVNPRGMAYTMTVVVQLHPLFITRVDRAYAVRCFYMEVEKNVGAALGVSELSTAVLAEDHAQPRCGYSLHQESPHGPLLKYAHVGDVVYHVWECPSDVYSMLVHSCVVQDGQGNEHHVIDASGCSTDLYLMPELSYSSGLTKTFTASNAFNFPDDSSVQFSCQIKLCFKGNSDCNEMTPPKCSNHRKTFRRFPEDLGEVSDNVDSSTDASNNRDNIDDTFPRPKNLRKFIEEELEGSGETEERNDTRNDAETRNDTRLRRRNIESLDVDIQSPELTVLEREAGSVGEQMASRLEVAPRQLVCVPMHALWLLAGVLLLSLSFLLATICKAQHRKGFVQF